MRNLLLRVRRMCELRNLPKAPLSDEQDAEDDGFWRLNLFVFRVVFISF